VREIGMPLCCMMRQDAIAAAAKHETHHAPLLRHHRVASIASPPLTMYAPPHRRRPPRPGPGVAPHLPRRLRLVGWCWRCPTATVLGCRLGCANSRSLAAARRRRGGEGVSRWRLDRRPSRLTERLTVGDAGTNCCGGRRE
jgi:hypothetical protein